MVNSEKASILFDSYFVCNM